MLTKNKTKAKLQAGEAVFGCFIADPVPVVVESLGGIGLDYVFLELEHNLVSGENIQHMIMAAELADLTPLIRVPIRSSDAILQVLEQGAMGVIVPHTQTKAEAQTVVELVKYGPEGKRGMWSTSRATGFGAIPLSQYVVEANKETMIACIIEDVEGYNNLAEILTVKGVDVIILGHEDLAQSLGYTGQYEHPVFKETVDNIISMTISAGKFMGIGSEPSKREDVAQFFSSYFERGIRFFLLNPLRLMRNAEQELVDSAKAVIRSSQAR